MSKWQTGTEVVTFIHQATDTSSTNISTLHQFSDFENKKKKRKKKMEKNFFLSKPIIKLLNKVREHRTPSIDDVGVDK